MRDLSPSEHQSASFYEWLGLQRHRNDSVGRIAVEAHRDPTFPRTAIQRLHTFLHYYRDKSELRNGIKQAHSKWRKYKQMGRPKKRKLVRHLMISKHLENGPDIRESDFITRIKEEVTSDQQT